MLTREKLVSYIKNAWLADMAIQDCQSEVIRMFVKSHGIVSEQLILDVTYTIYSVLNLDFEHSTSGIVNTKWDKRS